jgi:putative sterol carrier protein
MAAGKVEGPDVTLTLSGKDAAPLCRGELDPSVAFMQGRLKVVGSMGVMIALLTAMNTSEYQGLRQKIAETTEF